MPSALKEAARAKWPSINTLSANASKVAAVCTSTTTIVSVNIFGAASETSVPYLLPVVCLSIVLNVSVAFLVPLNLSTAFCLSMVADFSVTFTVQDPVNICRAFMVLAALNVPACI